MKAEQFGSSLILLERLAVGGMGEVFRAKQVGTGGFEKTVAVKRLLPQFTSRDDFGVLFRQEMRLAARLQHSNIAQVFSNGVHGEHLYLVMEYIQGSTVADLITASHKSGEQIGIDHVCFIVSEAAKALQYAHTLHDEASGLLNPVVHRDVTPQNIMCSENGEVKVLDFGLAKVIDSVSEFSRIGDVKGKVQYVAPEQLQGERASPQTDIFSLGVVMFELLVGRPLFLNENPYGTIQNIMNMPTPSVGSLRPGIPLELERIVSEALEKHPSRRFASAEEFHRKLAAFLNTTFPRYSPTELGKKVRIDSKLLSGSSHQHTAATRAVSSSADSFGSLGSVARYRRSRVRSSIIVASAIALGVGLGVEFHYARFPEAVPSLMSAAPVSAGPVAVFDAQSADVDNEGRVYSWKDTSGGEPLAFVQAATSAQPMLVRNAVGSYSAVRFDGIDDFLVGNELAGRLSRATELSIVFVAKVSAPHVGYLFSLQQADGDFDVFRAGIDTSTNLRVKTIEEPWIRMFFASDKPFAQGFAVVSITVKRSLVEAFLNGEFWMASNLPAPVPFSKARLASLGQEYDGGRPSDFIKADVLEVQIFERALDVFARNLLEQSLAAKYGIAIKVN
jgi:serine/threonine protein kinase